MRSSEVYRAYGLNIASAIPLALRTGTVGPADVSLEIGDQEALLSGPLDGDADGLVAVFETGGSEGPWYVATDEGDRIRLRVRGVGEFHLSPDLHTVSWIALPGGRSELAPILFAGTVLSLLLILRGDLVLHASAVTLERRTLAFVGQSGRGKTTMAALCAAAGGRLVTDDVLLVSSDDDCVRCCGSGGELRLRPAARELADRFVQPAGRHQTADERTAVQPRDTEAGWTELGAIVIPFPSREAEQVDIERLSTADALFSLLSFPRVDGLRPNSIVGRQFSLLGELARRLPVYAATIPWGQPFRTDIGPRMLELLAPIPHPAEQDRT